MISPTKENVDPYLIRFSWQQDSHSNFHFWFSIFENIKSHGKFHSSSRPVSKRGRLIPCFVVHALHTSSNPCLINPCHLKNHQKLSEPLISYRARTKPTRISLALAPPERGGLWGGAALVLLYIVLHGGPEPWTGTLGLGHEQKPRSPFLTTSVYYLLHLRILILAIWRRHNTVWLG